eukprot:TRINITY_DN958_c0_g2_i1.p1 TRINITY_DN958_c0_g2~~TRINITY_DN958_c0_g2_i1.p1  ORF type:complete len:574 (-),score=155.31 TRINITY_DN958_c0_g2_i1:71-1792(-)
MNEEKRDQKFYVAHTDDILCLAMHPNGTYVVTAQLDPKGKEQKPLICVWDSTTAQEVSRWMWHERGIVAITFNADGKYLMSIGNDDSHSLAIWLWESDTKQPLYEIPASKEVVFAIKPHPTDPLAFLTYGMRHMKFWTIIQQNNNPRNVVLESSLAVTQAKSGGVIQSAYHCALFKYGTWIVGTHSGELYQFRAGQLDQIIPAHFISREQSNPVASICGTPSGFATGGYDNHVKLWNDELKLVADIDLCVALNTPERTYKVRSMDSQGNKVVLGTKESDILLMNVDDQSIKSVIQGHASDVTTLAMHPTRPQYVTAEYDVKGRNSEYLLYAWDIPSQTACGGPVKFPSGVSAAAFHPEGEFLVLGLDDGKVQMFRYDGLQREKEKKVGNEVISVLEYSPDGTTLAVGSWDQSIYILEHPSLKIVRKLSGFASSILSLTWSADGKCLVSTTKDYELAFWNMETGQRVDPGTVADVEYRQWSALLGWPVQGIFNGGADGTDVNTCHIPASKKAVVTGDDFGCVRMYRYPCISQRAEGKSYRGHSSHVMSVRFSSDENHVISVGSADTAVFQWRYV